MTGRVLKKAWMRKRPRGLNHSVSRKSSWKERWFELEKETLSCEPLPPSPPSGPIHPVHLAGVAFNHKTCTNTHRVG